ncbi:hypothetical protein QJQ45_024953, partial [Haematococcus lacustris]
AKSGLYDQHSTPGYAPTAICSHLEMPAMPRLIVACVLLALGVTEAGHPRGLRLVLDEAAVGSATLPPFHSVRACVPFIVLIAAPEVASLAGNGSLALAADAAVISRVNVSVTRGVLSISIAPGGFATSRTIRCTLTTANASSLRSVQSFGAGTVVVGPGFQLERLQVVASGASSTHVLGPTIEALNVSAAGSSSVVVNGTINSAQIRAEGTAKVVLAGAVGEVVTVRAADIASVSIQSSQATRIQGRVSDLGKVQYTQGRCSLVAPPSAVERTLSSGDICTKVTMVPSSRRPVWSCGMKVVGSSSCSMNTTTSPSLAAEATQTPTDMQDSSSSPNIPITLVSGTAAGPTSTQTVAPLVPSAATPTPGLTISSNGDIMFSSSGNGGDISFSSSSSSSSGPGGAVSSLAMTSQLCLDIEPQYVL